MKPEEIAMCRDALLEAGVPDKIVSDLIHFAELGDRTQILMLKKTVDDFYAAAETTLIDSIKRSMHFDLAKALVDQGVAEITERRTNLQTEITLSLPVVVPLGWKAQAPAVQR